MVRPKTVRFTTRGHGNLRGTIKPLSARDINTIRRLPFEADDLALLLAVIGGVGALPVVSKQSIVTRLIESASPIQGPGQTISRYIVVDWHRLLWSYKPDEYLGYVTAKPHSWETDLSRINKVFKKSGLKFRLRRVGGNWERQRGNLVYPNPEAGYGLVVLD